MLILVCAWIELGSLLNIEVPIIRMYIMSLLPDLLIVAVCRSTGNPLLIFT